jgi:rubrerythrin
MSVAERLRMLSDLEEKYAIELDKEYRGYGNEIVRQLITSIMVDSKKHAGLYKTAAYIMEGKSLSIMDLEFEELEKHLKLHIEKEQEMIDAAKNLMDEVEDQRVKKILTWIYEDELFHHPMLKVLLEVVLKRETISEEDVWDMVFRDLPTHGAPGP